MAANRDEAIKCIAISQRHLNSGNFASARRFAEKSLSLFPTPEAKRLVELIALRESEPSTSSSTAESDTPQASASGAEAHPTRDSTHQRHHAHGNGSANGSASDSEKKREYTPEMAAVVKRVKRCKVTDYYAIMELQKDCEEADVKRAYRKV